MIANHKASTANPVRPSWPTPKPKDAPILKVVKETYRGLAPEDQNLVQLYLALPPKQSPTYIDPSDAVVKKALDTIREQYEVWINVDDTGLCFIIEGATIQSTAGAMREIRDFLHLQAKSLGGSVTVIAHRIGGSQTDIKLKRVVQVAGARFGLPEGSFRAVALPGATDRDLADVVQRHMVKELFEAIQKAVRSLRPDVGQKFVRIHLGLRTLSKKMKSEASGLEGNLSKENSVPFNSFDPKALDTYDTAQYESLLDSATKRGHSYFNLCFGDERLEKTILRHIHETDHGGVLGSKFVAVDATVGRLEDVQPQFTLVFFSIGYRIEMDIYFESRPAYGFVNSARSLPEKWNFPTASPPRVFRFNKMVDSEVIVPCPDMKVDWQITVESDLSANKVHDKFRTLATEVRFDKVRAGTVIFPTVHISRASLVKASIDGIAMKVYRTFECAQAPYHVEVATYYDWNAHPLPQYLAKPDIMEYEFGTEIGSKCPLPNKSCAISLYGRDWDDHIRNLNPASMDFSAELLKIFYDQEVRVDHGEKVAGELTSGNMLREVEFLLDITTQAATELESVGPSDKDLEDDLDKLEELDEEDENNYQPSTFPATATTQAASVPDNMPSRTGIHSEFIPRFNYGPIQYRPIQDPTQAMSLLDIQDTAQGQTDAMSPIDPGAIETAESLMDFGPETRSECLLDFDAQSEAS